MQLHKKASEAVANNQMLGNYPEMEEESIESHVICFS
jgi:hypothetical protein